MERHSNTESRGQTDLDTFKVWKEYEKIAIHFNDLILKLRIQSLGGVATISALVGLILQGKFPAHLRWHILTITFAVLLAFWIAIAVLDLCYYNRLLFGAVDAILNIEKRSAEGSRIRTLDLSHKIRKEVEKYNEAWDQTLTGPNLFYAIVGVTLLILAIFSYCASL